jgi:hypothetical protein
MNNKFEQYRIKPDAYYTKKYCMLFAYKARLLINKLLWK